MEYISFSILQDKAERVVASKCEDGATLNSIINVSMRSRRSVFDILRFARINLLLTIIFIITLRCCCCNAAYDKMYKDNNMECQVISDGTWSAYVTVT